MKINKIYIAIIVISLAAIASNALAAIILPPSTSEADPRVLEVTCTGSISISLDKSSVGPSESITASVSAPSCTSGKTIQYKMDLSSPCCSSVSQFQCALAGSSGCNWDFNAGSSTGTYTIRAFVDVNNDGDSMFTGDPGELSSTSLTVSPCTTTKPSQTFALDNKCSVKIEATGLDVSDGTDGRYLNTVSDSNKITTEFDDAVSEGCGKDLKFSNAWNTGGATDKSWLSITSNRLEKKGCGFFGLFCPHDTAYGFTLSTSGTCSILERITSCVPTGDQQTCPPAGFGTKSSLALVKDTASFQTHTFRIGECSTNSDCNTLKGSGSTCNTATKICTSAIEKPVLTSPADGATVTTLNPILEWTTVTGAINYKFYARTSSQTPEDPTHSFCSLKNLGVALNLKGGSKYFWSAKACTDSSCDNCGDYATERSFTPTDCKTASTAKDVGTMTSTDTKTGQTCSLSSFQQDDWFKVTLSRTFHLKATLSSPADWDFWVCDTGVTDCNDANAVFRSSPFTALDTETAVSTNLIGGEYLIKIHRISGDGTGTLTLSKADCVLDSECGFEPTTKIKGTCRSPSGTGGIPNDYTCRFGLTCGPSTIQDTNSNSNCAPSFCCESALPTTINRDVDASGGVGNCVDIGKLSPDKRYLCINQ